MCILRDHGNFGSKVICILRNPGHFDSKHAKVSAIATVFENIGTVRCAAPRDRQHGIETLGRNMQIEQAAASPFTAGAIAVPVTQQTRRPIYESLRNGSFTAAS